MYHDGYFDEATKHDIIRRRHAEIAIKGGLDINRYFKGVICRSNTERKTLLYLLRQVDLRLYEKYKTKITTASINNPYYGNGIYIDDVYYNQQEIEILFNSPNCRQFAHGRTHDTIISSVKLKWYSQEKKLENVNTHNVPIYYNMTERLKIKLPQIYSDYMELTVHLDERLMCCYVIDFTDIHILG